MEPIEPTQRGLLEAAGKALYGEHGDDWKKLRFDLNIGERNWLKFVAETKGVPPGVWDEIQVKLRQRAKGARLIAGVIDEMLIRASFLS